MYYSGEGRRGRKGRESEGGMKGKEEAKKTEGEG